MAARAHCGLRSRLAASGLSVREFRRRNWNGRGNALRERLRIELGIGFHCDSLFVLTSSDGAVLGACLALAMATVLFIFYIQPDASDLAPHRTKLDQLMEQRDTIYDNLRDLRFEFRSGKYSEGDYEAMKTGLENDAAMVLAEIDRVTEAQVRRPRGARPADAERGA